MVIGLRIPSYERFEVRGARAVVAKACTASIRSILETENLYDYAARQSDTTPLVGRAPVFALNLEGCGRVVVRHNMRGGWIAKFSKDIFVLPTRGFRELVASLRLRASGVSTPEVIAYVSYPMNVILRRFDVATREIPNGHDLSVALAKVTDHNHRVMVLDAVVNLLKSLTHAGAYHQDLNLKNVLLTAGEGPGLDAHVLDVDRVRFSSPGSPLVAKANLDRLFRSLRKWRDLHELPYSAEDEEYLRLRSVE
ncbi:MAG TPA: lipopolysaccharide kinase InaA family protein [Gemmatimonadaceae bacterium]